MSDKPEPAACQHEWVFLKTEKYVKPGVGICFLFPPTIKVDIFYCRKCLEYQERTR